MKKSITEKSLKLERFTRNDIEVFWSFYRDPNYAEFFRRCPKIWTEEELLQFEKTTSSTLFKIVLETPNEVIIIGFIVLNEVCWHGLNAKLGIGLFKYYQDYKIGKLKICFLAMREISKLCFDQMPLTKICVKFLKKRVDIEKSLLIAGFKKEGDYKENIMYDGLFEDEVEYALSKSTYMKLYKGN